MFLPKIRYLSYPTHIFKEKSINYFVCLRHLLVNLKFNEFSYALKNIIFAVQNFIQISFQKLLILKKLI